MVNDYIAKENLTLYIMQHSEDERINQLLPYLNNGDLDDTLRLYTSYGWDAKKMVDAFLSQDDDAEDDIPVLDGEEEPKQPEKQSRRRQTKSAQKAASKSSKKSSKETKEKHFRWNPSITKKLSSKEVRNLTKTQCPYVLPIAPASLTNTFALGFSTAYSIIFLSTIATDFSDMLSALFTSPIPTIETVVIIHMLCIAEGFELMLPLLSKTSLKVHSMTLTNFVSRSKVDKPTTHYFVMLSSKGAQVTEPLRTIIPSSCRSPMQIDGKLDQRGGYNPATCLPITWWYYFWNNLCSIAYTDTCFILDLSPLLYSNIQGLMAYLTVHDPDPLPNICLHTAFVDDRVHGPIAQSLFTRLITTWSSEDLANLALLCMKLILAKRSPREKRSRSRTRIRKSQEKKNKDKSHKRHRKKTRHDSSSSSNSESSSNSNDASSISQ